MDDGDEVFVSSSSIERPDEDRELDMARIVVPVASTSAKMLGRGFEIQSASDVKAEGIVQCEHQQLDLVVLLTCDLKHP